MNSSALSLWILQKFSAQALAGILSLTLISGAFAQNLIANPGFEAGNTGFGTDYALWAGQPAWGANLYYVTNNPQNSYSGWDSSGDHTSGTGQLLIVDGSTVAGRVFWRQTIPVATNTNYFFRAWTLKFENQAPPILYLTINGVPQGTNYVVPTNQENWKTFDVSWNSGAASSALLELRFSTTNGFGNNLAFDDLYFSTTPHPSTVVPIPTLSEWGLIILTALLLGVGVMLIKKQSVKTLLTLFAAATHFASPAQAAILAGPITNPANTHVYFLLTSNTWTSAETEAVTLGGHLATINDRAENDWICTQFITNGGIQRSLWIGLYQPNGSPEPTGGWTWVSGETSDFRWWITNASGTTAEPNNNTAFGPQNWAHIWPPVVGTIAPGSYRTNSWNDYWNVGMVVDPILTNQMIGLYGVVEVEPPLPVPTLSDWALIILGGLMLGVGIVFIRGRQGNGISTI